MNAKQLDFLSMVPSHLRADLEAMARTGVVSAALVANDARVAAHDRAVKRAKELERRAAREERLAELGVPLDARGKHLAVRGECDSSSARAIAEARLEGFPFVLLLGSVGNGKTTACAEALLACAGSAAYVTAPDLAALRRSIVREDRERIALMKRCSVLVIDEVGAEVDAKEREYSRGAIFEIVDKRQTPPMLTVFVGNLTLREFREHVDPRTIDRMRGLTKSHVAAEQSRRGDVERRAERRESSTRRAARQVAR